MFCPCGESNADPAPCSIVIILTKLPHMTSEFTSSQPTAGSSSAQSLKAEILNLLYAV